MENNLTEREIIKVYGMYIGCDLQCPLSESPKTNGIVKCGGIGYEDAYNALYWTTKEWEYCKLILTPLSAITDEHAIDAALVGEYLFDDEDKEDCKRVISYFRNGEIDSWKSYQYLVLQRYAVPLFFGVNHWANGKTAIELNLAVEAKLIF